jgi:hypothetical protein
LLNGSEAMGSRGDARELVSNGGVAR